jgi:hypothetical protein
MADAVEMRMVIPFYPNIPRERVSWLKVPGFADVLRVKQGRRYRAWRLGR